MLVDMDVCLLHRPEQKHPMYSCIESIVSTSWVTWDSSVFLLNNLYKGQKQL